MRVALGANSMLACGGWRCGAKAGEIPIEQPTKFDLVINLVAAKALRITIPPSLYARADTIIE